MKLCSMPGCVNFVMNIPDWILALGMPHYCNECATKAQDSKPVRDAAFKALDDQYKNGGIVFADFRGKLHFNEKAPTREVETLDGKIKVIGEETAEFRDGFQVEEITA